MQTCNAVDPRWSNVVRRYPSISLDPASLIKLPWPMPNNNNAWNEIERKSKTRQGLGNPFPVCSTWACRRRRRQMHERYMSCKIYVLEREEEGEKRHHQYPSIQFSFQVSKKKERRRNDLSLVSRRSRRTPLGPIHIHIKQSYSHSFHSFHSHAQSWATTKLTQTSSHDPLAAGPNQTRDMGPSKAKAPRRENGS